MSAAVKDIEQNTIVWAELIYNLTLQEGVLRCFTAYHVASETSFSNLLLSMSLILYWHKLQFSRSLKDSGFCVHGISHGETLILISWIHAFLYSIHIFIGPARTFIKTVLFLCGMYICALYPIP